MRLSLYRQGALNGEESEKGRVKSISSIVDKFVRLSLQCSGALVGEGPDQGGGGAKG